MRPMKLRLLLVGCTISALSAIVIGARGVSTAIVGLLLVGLVLLVIGLLLKNK